MNVDGLGFIQQRATGYTANQRARTPEEAAKQFEAILVQQLVKTMTDGMFKANLLGKDGPGWIKSQGDAQRDILADVLTERLVESGVFKISDLMVRKWSPLFRQSDASESTPEGALPTPGNDPIAIKGENE